VRLRVEPSGVLCKPYSAVAPNYDRLTGFADFRLARRAFEFLVKRYGLEFRSAVDIGCGTGLFACYLNQRFGAEVFAVDRSQQMLSVAARRCPSPHVHYLCQDFRYLCLPCPVDLATANTFTLNHLMSSPAIRQAFARIRDHLVPGGHLVFDLLTDRQPAHLLRHKRRRLTAPGQMVFQRIHWNPKKRTLSIAIAHRSLATGAVAAESYVGRGYSLLEVGECLLRSGYTIRGIHDKATLTPAGPHSSQVVVVAVRV
jgi:trans-aconitate methyltransferase